MKLKDFLPYYASRFRTAEINHTFYQLPKRETLSQWREVTPVDLVFACKASRYITHLKNLRDPGETVPRFFKVIEALDDKQGPVPRSHSDVTRLDAFLEALSSGRDYAFQFRDDSWFSKGAYEALTRHHAAFCVYDLGGQHSAIEVTAEFVYVRLHGPDGPYRGTYDGRTVRLGPALPPVA